MGILFAVAALACWGVGDFLIQRAARKTGDVISLFYITAFGAIILFPFVYSDLLVFLRDFRHSGILLATGAVSLFASMFDFEGLRRGKISVVESVQAMEVFGAAILAGFLVKEVPSFLQLLTIAVLITGILLVSVRKFRSPRTLKRLTVEAGVFYAAIGMLGMSAMDTLVGIGARRINPIFINWFLSAFIALFTLLYIFYTSQSQSLFNFFRENKKLTLSVSVLDNLAWVFFAYSMLYLPVAIATGLSESYIAIAVVLGLALNKEKLKKHQFVGLGLTIASAVTLAFLIG